MKFENDRPTKVWGPLAHKAYWHLILSFTVKAMDIIVEVLKNAA